MTKSTQTAARFVAAIFMAVLGMQAAAEDFTTRSGGPSEKQMLARSGASPAEGLAFVRPVLTGVLYRAGFKGGDKSRTGLSSSQRTQLCEAGFSRAYYADFGKNTDYGTTSCGSGALDYQSARSSRPSAVMKSVHDRITGRRRAGAGALHVGRTCLWRALGDGAGAILRLVRGAGKGLLERGPQWCALFWGLRCLDRQQVRQVQA